MTAKAEATLADLYQVPEDSKAELAFGELVCFSPTGAAPNYAAGEVFASLREYAQRTGRGRAVTDNAAFQVDLPHRQSVSPDAAFYTGKTQGMKFFEEAPDFAVEVRSENDYGEAAEEKIAQKRTDYFRAGTLVVWDVDLLSENVVRVFRASDPETPTIYRRSQLAEADPAVPGWSMPVDDLFESR